MMSSVDFGSITRVKIYWGDSSLISYTDSQPYPGKMYSHNYPNPVSNTPVNYTIRMISSSGITCEDENDQQITIQPSPHAQFNPIPSLCVYDSPIVISQASELTGLPGNFTFTGTGISAEGIIRPSKSQAQGLLNYYTSIFLLMDAWIQPIKTLQYMHPLM